MRIEDITREKGRLWKLTLDDGRAVWLHADLLAESGLKTGDTLSEDALSALSDKAAEHRAFEYALYLLEGRAFSYRELYDRLMQARHAQEDAVLRALQRLVRLGFVNDGRYAEQLARQYVEGKQYGIRRAAYEMRHRGLSQSDIDSALEPYDDPERISEQLLTLLQKKYARYLTDPDDRKMTEKVTASLVRRGFTYQQIRYALEDYYAAQETE
ncbi:MAG: RecX family transcriptional regulator [Oscillospiraceae bacterium]|nr:RecX family transcriptional regulator [Oscillospiraceae bacterium]